MATVEREWADANPKGRIKIINDSQFALWNFEINKSHLRPGHSSFIDGLDFLNFLERHIGAGRKIVIIGNSSRSSGASRLNRTLANARAISVGRKILSTLQDLQGRGHIDNSLNAQQLVDFFEVSSNPGTDLFYFYEDERGIRIPPDDEGIQMAINRSVMISVSSSGRMNESQVSNCVSNYLRRKISSLPQHIDMRELWIPDPSSIVRVIPSEHLPGISNPFVASISLRDRSWQNVRPGYRALNTLGIGYLKLGDFLNSSYFDCFEVQSRLDQFKRMGNSALRAIQEREADLLRLIEGSHGMGSTINEELSLYIDFREQILLRDPFSLIRFQGFTPVIYRGGVRAGS